MSKLNKIHCLGLIAISVALSGTAIAVVDPMTKSPTFKCPAKDAMCPVTKCNTSAKLILPKTLPKGAIACDPSKSNTRERIEACITRESLVQHMTDLQCISDSNPDRTLEDPFGSGKCHGSRDLGTCGDIASVLYLEKSLKDAGYTVTRQTYQVPYSYEASPGVLERVDSTLSNVLQTYVEGTDFGIPTYSGRGDVRAQVQPVVSAAPTVTATGDVAGCAASDFAAFVPGRIALMVRGGCANHDKVINAIAAGAVGVITMNFQDALAGNTLVDPTGIENTPVFSYIPESVGRALYDFAVAPAGLYLHMRADAVLETRTTYNVIADSRFGDANNTVVWGAHYDSLFGAGINDNGSGTVGILNIALALKDTPTINHTRFVFFGAEEVGTLGSDYYVNNPNTDLNRIGFVLDADVLATPNFIVEVSDLKNTTPTWTGYPDPAPQQVLNASQIATDAFKNYFASLNPPIPTVTTSRETQGSCGTDGCLFGSAGIPWAFTYTGQGSFSGGGKNAQDCLLYGTAYSNLNICPVAPVVSVPFESCIDTPYVYCDNVGTAVNFDIMLPMTKAYSTVGLQLTNTKNLKSLSQNPATPKHVKSNPKLAQ